ncbi:MAG: AAA family ATPase [Desulfarculaceae bacterium]|nr:AAA family ATPase [Desulfarculaceae bacterium]
MRIKRLDLTAFGPFTDRSLEFDGPDTDYHIIYGPNEAGKSSALRALRQLFFGIPEQSADDFIHPYRKLRIGGTIESKDRGELSFIRRKARKVSLTYPDDKTPMDESTAGEMMGHIEPQLFETMFGIDHETLVRGGREILNGEGATGEILFSAGAGLADLRRIQTDFAQKAEALFKKGGKNPVINETVSAVSGLKKEIAREQLSEKEYEETYTALKDFESKADDLSSKIREKRKRLNHLQRIFNSFDAIARRREILEKLDTMARRDTDSKGANDKIISRKEPVTALYQELGAIDRNTKEKVRLKSDLEGFQREAVDILRRLGRDIPIEEAESLRVSKEREFSIKKEGGELSRFLIEYDGLEKEIARKDRKIKDLKEKSEKAVRVPDYKSLEACMKKALDEGSIEHRYREKLEEIESMNREFQDNFMYLKGLGEEFEKDPERFFNIKVPPMEAIETYEKEFRDLETAMGGIREKLSAKDREIAAAEMELSVIELSGPVPTEKELTDLRETRDRGWIIIRKLLSGRQQARAEADAFAERFHGCDGIESAYEHSVRQADDMSDRLRLISDQAAKKASARSQKQKLEKERKSLEKEKEEISARMESLTLEWQRIWEAAPVNPDSPADMRHWLLRYRNAASVMREIGKKKVQAGKDKDRIEELKKELSDHLAQIYGKEPEKEASLETLVRYGGKAVEQFRGMEKDAAFLEKEIADLTADLNSALERKKALETRIGTKKEAWGKLVAPLGLSKDASPELAAEMLEEHRALFEKISALERTRGRLGRIEREKTEFETRVARLVGEMGYVKPGADARADVEMLNSMLSAAEREVEEQTKLKRELEQREKEIHRHSRGRTLQEFTREVLSYDPDDLEPQIRTLEGDLRELENSKAAVDRKTGEKKTELAAMDGSSKALDLLEHKESLLSQLETYTEQYAAWKVASALLQKAVERFREKNQEQLLTRSGEIFRTLTLQGFDHIRVDFTGSDKAAIAGVRSGTGESVFPEGMSSGTRDQLYLALRIASIEKYIHAFEPLPFIVDDILVQFDGERAKAAFQVLGELSGKTQVIFFTHNRHFVDIAGENTGALRPFVHEL